MPFDYALDGWGYVVLGLFVATFVIWRRVAVPPEGRAGEARQSLLALCVLAACVLFGVPTLQTGWAYDVMFRIGLEVSLLATGLMWIDIVAWRRRQAARLPTMRLHV